MAKTQAGKAVAAYGTAARRLADVPAAETETPAYTAANDAKGEAYKALPRGTRAYAATKHG